MPVCWSRTFLCTAGGPGMLAPISRSKSNAQFLGCHPKWSASEPKQQCIIPQTSSKKCKPLLLPLYYWSTSTGHRHQATVLVESQGKAPWHFYPLPGLSIITVYILQSMHYSRLHMVCCLRRHTQHHNEQCPLPSKKLQRLMNIKLQQDMCFPIGVWKSVLPGYI